MTRHNTPFSQIANAIIGLLGGCSSSPSKHALWGPHKFKNNLYKCRFFENKFSQNDTTMLLGEGLELGWVLTEKVVLLFDWGDMVVAVIKEKVNILKDILPVVPFGI